MLDIAQQHFDAGRFSEAENLCRNIRRSDPNAVDALCTLGKIACRAGRDEVAVDLLNRVIGIKPDHVDAHINLGDALKNLGRWEDAVVCYHDALAILPDDVEVHHKLGAIFHNLGKLDEAIAGYRKALAIKSDFVEALSNLGTVFHEQGDLDQAEASYRQAIALKPDFAQAHFQLASMKRFSEYDDNVRAMEQAHSKPTLGKKQAMYLAYGLGKAFEDLHDYDRTFRYFAEANSIQPQGFTYSSDFQADYFGILKETFSRALFSQFEGKGDNDETPIFILGMPRSGTTLVEQILASHSQVHGAGELKTLKRVTFSCFDKHEDIQQIERSELSRLGAEYVEAVRKHSPDCRFITDKMPANLRFIGIIRLILPNAKVIHCQRNPVDVCLSIYKNHFSANLEFANDLRELGHYYNLYRDLMDHWRDVIPGFIHDVRYEDIIADQPGQTKALLEY